jgi:hypothetical protein
MRTLHVKFNATASDKFTKSVPAATGIWYTPDTLCGNLRGMQAIIFGAKGYLQNGEILDVQDISSL